jgi:hypothetical protein
MSEPEFKFILTSENGESRPVENKNVGNNPLNYSLTPPSRRSLVRQPSLSVITEQQRPYTFPGGTGKYAGMNNSNGNGKSNRNRNRKSKGNGNGNRKSKGNRNRNRKGNGNGRKTKTNSN